MTAEKDSGPINRKMNDSERDKMKAARVFILNKVPYVAAGLYRSPIVVSTETESMSHDSHGRIYINPDKFAEWGVPTLASGVIHSLTHIYRKHPARLDDYRRNVKNVSDKVAAISTDIEVNDDMFDLGFNIPDDAILSAQVGLTKNKPFEFYVKQFKDGDGSSSSDSAGAASGGLIDPDAVETEWCGETAVENEDDTSSRIPSQVIDALGAQMAKDALEHYKSRGSIPGGIQRWITEALEKPKVPWYKKFNSFGKGVMSNSAMKTSYTYKRPSRRAGNDDIAAGRVGFSPQILFAVDTSGSMSQGDLVRALSEANSMAASHGGKMQAFCVDAEIHEPTTFKNAKNFTLTGNGGTDMRLAFDYVRELRKKPDLFVLATDGETPWPKESEVIPGVSCIALLTSKPSTFRMNDIPSWIEVIELND